MKAFIVNSTGKKDEKTMSKQYIVEKFGIANRDLRPVFTKKQITSVLPRGKCIIVNARSTKLIIGGKETLIFDISDEDISTPFIEELIEKIKKEKKEKIRFEHIVLECVLTHTIEKLSKKYEIIERSTEQILGRLSDKLSDKDFEQLLHIKKQISKLSTLVEEWEEELETLIEDEKDLKEFYLGKPPKDTEDIESILEGALEQIEDLSNKIEDLTENIEDTQEIINLKLSTRRNVIIKFDLLLTAATVMIGIPTVITGMYGMNVPNQLENHPFAFLIISATLLIIFCSGFAILLLWLKKKKIL